MHGRIIGNFVLKFIFLGLPAIGIIIAESTLWNSIWWVVYFAWGAALAKHELATKTCIGTIWAQLPFLILIEFQLASIWLWLGAGLWAGMAYVAIYKQAVTINAMLGNSGGNKA